MQRQKKKSELMERIRGRKGGRKGGRERTRGRKCWGERERARE